jgi:hypothetical protein
MHRLTKTSKRRRFLILRNWNICAWNVSLVEFALLLAVDRELADLGLPVKTPGISATWLELRNTWSRPVVAIFGFCLLVEVTTVCVVNCAASNRRTSKEEVKEATGCGDRQGCETSRFPHFLDIRLTDGADFRRMCLLPIIPRKVLGTHFC